MQMYLTAVKSKERIQIPLLPDKVSVKTSAATVNASILKLGEVKIPRGSNLAGYSWDGTLPGEHMRKFAFLCSWASPSGIAATLKSWMENGTTLNFLVTELTINVDVFIDSFTFEYSGGSGDITYNISLTVRRNLSISTIPPPVTVPTVPAGSDSSSSSSTATASKTKKKYGVVRLNNKSSNLNVRQKKSTSAKILGKLKYGAKVELLGKSGNWYTIPYSKGTGGKAYVYSSYIKVTSS